MEADDQELFQQAMQDVKPLTSKTRDQSKAKAPRATKRTTAHDFDQEAKSSYFSLEPRHWCDRDEKISFSNPSIPRRILTQMKQGNLPIDARLDLHGLTAEAASETLPAFLRRSQRNGARCVLVIHGKGGFDANQRSILKSLSNQWLREMPELVLAFHSAATKHGGAGAVYVLLKRDRA